MNRKIDPIDIIQQRFSHLIIHRQNKFEEDSLTIANKDALLFFNFLKSDPQLAYIYLTDITAVDYLNNVQTERFEVVYHLYSFKNHHRLRVKIPVKESNSYVISIAAIWKSADWAEREVYDMYGIQFRGHPNLKRILMYEEFEGYPLRKDYPINKRQPLI